MLGMGGYAAGPAGLAAWVSRCPLVIHEQNAIAGTTNRWLAPLAVQVLRGLPGSFGARQDTPVVGNPVRAQLHPADRSELDHLAEFNEVRPLKVLVLGGSLGAAPLNALLPSTCDLLCELGFGGARLDLAAVRRSQPRRGRPMLAAQSLQRAESG